MTDLMKVCKPCSCGHVPVITSRKINIVKKKVVIKCTYCNARLAKTTQSYCTLEHLVNITICEWNNGKRSKI